MTLRNLAGWSMITAPFVALFAFGAATIGFLVTALIFAFAFGLQWLIATGCRMASEKAK